MTRNTRWSLVSYLESHDHNEYLATHFAIGIETVGNGRPDTNDDSKHQQALTERDHIRVASDGKNIAKRKKARDASNCGENHEENAEFWFTVMVLAEKNGREGQVNLLDTTVHFRNVLDHAVPKNTGDY